MDTAATAAWAFRLALVAALVPLGILATFQTPLEDPVWYVGQAATVLALAALVLAAAGTPRASQDALLLGIGGWAALRLLGMVLSALQVVGGLDLFGRTVFFQALALLQALALAHAARTLLAAQSPPGQRAAAAPAR